MKKITLVLCCISVLGFSAAARAEWTSVATNKNGTMRFFIDVETIKPINGNFKSWIMESHDELRTIKATGIKYQSAKFLQEFNCTSGQSRVLATILYQEAVGAGEITYSNVDASNPAAWKETVPGSVGGIQLEAVCTAREWVINKNAKGWQQYFDSSYMTASFDKLNVKRVGSTVRTQILFDYKNPKPLDFAPFGKNGSDIYFMEIDCLNDTEALGSVIVYSGRKSDGAILQYIPSTSMSDPVAIEPYGMNAALLKAVCPRK